MTAARITMRADWVVAAVLSVVAHVGIAFLPGARGAAAVREPVTFEVVKTSTARVVEPLQVAPVHAEPPPPLVRARRPPPPPQVRVASVQPMVVPTAPAAPEPTAAPSDAVVVPAPSTP